MQFYKIFPESSLHVSLSDSVVVNTSNSTTQDVEAPNLLGFDRLRHYGFNQEEIGQLRTQFHAQRTIQSGFLGAGDPN